jgi:hypothetical protein
MMMVMMILMMMMMMMTSCPMSRTSLVRDLPLFTDHVRQGRDGRRERGLFDDVPSEETRGVRPKRIYNSVRRKDDCCQW